MNTLNREENTRLAEHYIAKAKQCIKNSKEGFGIDKECLAGAKEMLIKAGAYLENAINNIN